MAQVLVTEQHLMDTADAIRSKLGVQTTYKPREFADAIISITGGGGSEWTSGIYQDSQGYIRISPNPGAGGVSQSSGYLVLYSTQGS